MKLLERDRISSMTFIICCLFPLISLLIIGILHVAKPDESNSSSDEHSAQSKISGAIISVLQGPFKKDNKRFALYWEGMISVRHLLINALTLVRSGSVKMISMTGLCLAFLYQHNSVSPFKIRKSNHVEGLSLSLLIMRSVINLLKASLTDSGVVPSGPSVRSFKGLELSEKLFVFIIIAYCIYW